jgi:hypothetical protein
MIETVRYLDRKVNAAVDARLEAGEEDQRPFRERGAWNLALQSGRSNWNYDTLDEFVKDYDASTDPMPAFTLGVRFTGSNAVSFSAYSGNPGVSVTAGGATRAEVEDLLALARGERIIRVGDSIAAAEAVHQPAMIVSDPPPSAVLYRQKGERLATQIDRILTDRIAELEAALTEALGERDKALAEIETLRLAKDALEAVLRQAPGKDSSRITKFVAAVVVPIMVVAGGAWGANRSAQATEYAARISADAQAVVAPEPADVLETARDLLDACATFEAEQGD